MTKLKRGPSRRMQKQGMPAPLEDFLGPKKRKAADATDSRDKKRKRADGKTAKTAGKQNGSVKVVKQVQVKTIIKKVVKDQNGTNGAVEELDEDWESDEAEVTHLNALGSASEDEDDELGSDIIDSDLEEDRQAMWSEDEDDDALDKLTAANIEGLSSKLDKELADEEAEGEAELFESNMQTNIMGERPKILQDDDVDMPAHLAPDLRMLRERISETIRALEDFGNLGEEGRSRSEYTQQLLKDICHYYGYSPFLAEKLYDLFPPREAFAFFEANETPRPVVLRTNTLRSNRRALIDALTNRGVTTKETVKWSKVGLQIFESQVPLGATPEYMAGHYMLQTASSFLPVMALAPQEHERVLDMAAAPGGKTTHMAALMRNTGVIFANDANKQRSKGLIGNIHRLGVKNTIVSNYDAKEFPKVMGGFDRVLLDAPCTGTGVISKDASVKTNKSEQDFRTIPELQKRLILAAIDSVNHASKTGGYIVYSTCSVTVEENEMVIEYALRKRPNVKLVPTGLPIGREGFTRHMGKIFHHTMNLTRRYYPHTLNVDGFFVAKLKKTAQTKTVPTGTDATVAPEVEVDRTPLVEEEEEAEDDEFGGWDESEDEKIITKAKKAAARKKGINPRTIRVKK
jgi:ribosomal RNA methyltransferase Nop2